MLQQAAARDRGRCSSEGRHVCDGVRGRLRLELRAHLARRPPHPRSGRAGGVRRVPAQARAGRGRSPGASVAGVDVAGDDERARHELLLLVPGASLREAARHRRRVGLLPRRGRRGGRGAGDDRAGGSAERAGAAREVARGAGRLLRRRDGRRRRRARACSRSSAGSRCRARRSTRSSTASRWTSTAPATRRSTTCASTACASPRPSA